jgi:hypothetical protein
MHLTTREIVFPEGDSQEIPHALRVNQLVDLNGYPLDLPPTKRQIVYRVRKMTTGSHCNGEVISYYLEQVEL